MDINVKPATESEKTILGALFLDPSLFDSVDKILCPADFFDAFHQEIYEAIRDVNKARGTFDIAMVCDHANFIPDYLLMLSVECASTSNIVAHAEIVREKSVQRQLVVIAKAIADGDLNYEKI
jgi:replicative DNA helicase